jgi:hypothetical protein
VCISLLENKKIENKRESTKKTLSSLKHLPSLCESEALALPLSLLRKVDVLNKIHTAIAAKLS